MLLHKSQTLTIFNPWVFNNLGTTFFYMGISDGFASPAYDFKEQQLSLDIELIKKKKRFFLHD